MIVLDANILIRAVLGRRVRQLVDAYTGQGIRFFAPDIAFDDAEKYLPLLLKKRGKPVADLSACLQYLRYIIEPVPPELYAIFESDARQRLRGRDETDWPVLASALALACPVWTEDEDFRHWRRGVDHKQNRNFSQGTSKRNRPSWGMTGTTHE